MPVVRELIVNLKLATDKASFSAGDKAVSSLKARATKQLKEATSAENNVYRFIQKSQAEAAKRSEHLVTPKAAHGKHGEHSIFGQFKEFGKEELSGLSGELGAVLSAAGKFAAPIVMGAVLLETGKILADFTKEFVTDVNTISRTAFSLSLGFQELQEVAHLGKFVGLDTEQIGRGLKFLSVSMTDAREGKASYAKIFKDLNVDVTSTTGKGKSSATVLNEVLAALDKMPDSAKKVKVMKDLMGKTGNEMLRLLMLSHAQREEIEHMDHIWGAHKTEEDRVKAKEFAEVMAKVGIIAEGIKATLARWTISAFLPELQNAVSSFNLLNERFTLFKSEDPTGWAVMKGMGGILANLSGMKQVYDIIHGIWVVIREGIDVGAGKETWLTRQLTKINELLDSLGKKRATIDSIIKLLALTLPGAGTALGAVHSLAGRESIIAKEYEEKKKQFYIEHPDVLEKDQRQIFGAVPPSLAPDMVQIDAINMNFMSPLAGGFTAGDVEATERVRREMRKMAQEVFSAKAAASKKKGKH